ncbi:subtilisin-like serine protease [Frankia torreyi]|uniref:Subtilisin-like serine protease n=1 Tax=Frankia torreyi TaxID=1856 RepID=A0A0D8BL26_9ACTN|nr:MULTISPECIES: S8 family serine peptidase [Frankia]KJE24963.1 subtilisin-like serine protease [Frankia torreyi]KQM07154.1 subtilisin-like serine protease [Frankia sp. CpI1-P]
MQHRAMPRGPGGTVPRGPTRTVVPRRALRAVPAVLALLVVSVLDGPLLAVATPAVAAPAGVVPAPVAPAQGSQWYHAVLGLAQAQQISEGAGTVVAVIDGGVDAGHPKLQGQVLPGAGVGPGAASDGWRDDDPDGHGTAMAGLIAGRNDNGRPEVRGIAPAARILPISTGAEADSTEVARGIHRAVDLGADVINLSLGSAGAATPDEREAVAYAFAHDVVVVASAGNVETGDSEINSPANIPGVVAVTGSTARGDFWRGSSRGTRAVIAAPAPGIRAPVPTRVSPDGLDTGAGTSNSAAIVSGVVALIRSARPDLDAPNVIERLIYTARDAGAPGRDVEFGFGIVDPAAALTKPVPVVAANPLLATPTRWGTAGQAPAGADPTDAESGSGLSGLSGGADGADGSAGSGPNGDGGLGSQAAASVVPPTAAGARAEPADGAATPPGLTAGRPTGPTGPAGGPGPGHGAASGGGQGQDRDGGSVAAAGAGGPGGHPGILSALAWVGGLALAVWLGGLLGVGAHLLSARRTTTHEGPRGHS